MICKENLIKLGFEIDNDLGNDYLEYPLDLDLKLICSGFDDDDDNGELSVEFWPPQVSICFYNLEDVESLIKLIERNRN
tara:strand:- start:630 stop:866 length:237 start_codon:yes stop_codon:yes gene_type:complete